MDIPTNLMWNAWSYIMGETAEEETEGETTLQGTSTAGQGETYSQNKDQARKESNPTGNPSFDIRYAEKVDREQLLKHLETLNRVDLVRLSRSSYLKHANRYNVRN